MRNFLLSILLGVLAAPAFPQDLYDLKRIPEIRITFSEKNWSTLLDSMKLAGLDDRLAATLEIDGKKFEQVGVRYKGNSSYKNPRQKGIKKLPFNIKSNFLVKDQYFPGGYETLKLSNVFQDPSFLREVLSYEIARKYMPAPRCNFARLWVNGDYLGLYNNAESVDEKFLEKAFGTGKGTLIKCDPEWEDVKDVANDCPEGDKASLMYTSDDPKCYAGWYELQNNGKKGWQELITLTKILQKHPEKIGSVLNVDAALWMHAFNHVLVNLDSYTGRLSHNYYLFKTPDSLFTPLVWDMNISFGGFRFDGEKQGVLTDEEMQNFSLFVHYKNKNPKRPLITNLLANPLYRKIYVGHCRTILLENFANGEYLKRGLEIQKFIETEVKNDPQKLYGFDDFQKNLSKSVSIGNSTVIGIEELMKTRTQVLLNHPLFKGEAPALSNIKHKITPTGIEITGSAKAAIKVHLAYRHTRQAPFQIVEMFDDGAHGDGSAQDATWGASIENKPGTQYYLIAEGERLAVSAPERASFEFFEVKN